MKRLLIALLVSTLFVIAVSGCTEETSEAKNRRAGLIGNENLRLQLKEKDAKIAELQAKLDQCTKNSETLKSQSTQAGAGFIEMFAATSQKTIELEKENAALKAKIKELEK